MKIKQWFESWEWVVLFGVIVAIVLYAKNVSISQWPLATGGFLCVVAVLLFGLLLNMKTLRIRKGILMIGLEVGS